MASEKGATYLDKLCHKFYDHPKGHGEKTDYVCRLCGGPLETYYCEERLYLVQCTDCGTFALVKTANPEDAARVTLARPPSRIDREKWEPCEWCGSIGEKPDNWVCTLEDDNGHTVTNNHMVVCAPVNYCPVCGRPLTPEAWEELERRSNG